MHPEIIIGLIGAVGTDFNQVIMTLEPFIKKTDYKIEIIKASSLIENKTNKKPNTEVKRINEKIKQCNKETKKNVINKKSGIKEYGYMAAKMIEEIIKKRKNHDDGKIIYIVDSLKRKDELNLLRRVYGRNFIAVSIYQSEEERLIRLKSASINCIPADEEIKNLFEIDKKEDSDHGQQLSDIFWRAHYFMIIDEFLDKDLERFCNIIFSSPYTTPQKIELGMFLAYAISLRSSDPGRQVGAVICDDDGNIISSGCNDAPKFGGGLYWDDEEPDHRDFKLWAGKKDLSLRSKEEVCENIIEIIKPDIETLIKDGKLLENFLKKSNKKLLNESKIKDTIEFMRSVHGEEAAICDAALRGVSIKNCTIYCTTFPCHLCCKKIIAAGIKRVLFIEPYPKSKNEKFYNDEIQIVESAKDRKEEGKKVLFDKFRGVAPNRFYHVFKTEFKIKRKQNGKLTEFKLDKESKPKFLENRFPINYYLRELFELNNYKLISKTTLKNSLNRIEKIFFEL